MLIILADQMGRSVGDMRPRAPSSPALLTGLYGAGSSWWRSSARHGSWPCRPKRVPPRGQRQKRPAVPGVLTAVPTGVAVALANYAPSFTAGFKGSKSRGGHRRNHRRRRIAGVSLAFVMAVLNKITKLGLLSRMAERVTFVLIPPLLLIFLVLGTIFLGIATPTEGGAMGPWVPSSMAMARGASPEPAQAALTTTTKLSCFVVFILVGSTIFSLVFQGVDGQSGWSTC